MSETAETPQQDGRGARKTRTGVVTSAAGDKTIVVRIERRTTHNLYAKSLRRSKKYHAHDEKNEASAGDLVRIVETRPMSKTKRWRLTEIVERAR